MFSINRLELVELVFHPNPHDRNEEPLTPTKVIKGYVVDGETAKYFAFKFLDLEMVGEYCSQVAATLDGGETLERLLLKKVRGLLHADN